jgi:uncharacterized membrane protein
MAKKSLKEEKISSLYKEGLDITRKNFWRLLGVLLIATIIGMIFDGKERIFLEIIALIGTIFIANPLGMNTDWIALKAVRKKKYEVKEIFSVFSRKNYMEIVLGGLISGIFVVLGLLFLIIPGVIIAIRLTFVPYLLFDKNMKAMEAIKKSWELTKGYSWKIFGMVLLAILLVLIGIILLVLPVFFAIVWIMTTFAVLYNKRISQKK